jgi:hypothetical protein
MLRFENSKCECCEDRAFGLVISPDRLELNEDEYILVLGTKEAADLSHWLGKAAKGDKKDRCVVIGTPKKGF